MKSITLKLSQFIKDNIYIENILTKLIKKKLTKLCQMLVELKVSTTLLVLYLKLKLQYCIRDVLRKLFFRRLKFEDT